MKIEKIIEHLEVNAGDRKIARKYAVNREFLTKLYPRLLNVGTDDSLEALIADAIDIDRKIRRAKQLHPHLSGDKEEEVEELETKAKEDLGYNV
jgi:hypothetical protein